LNRPKLVAALLEDKRADVNKVQSQGATPLYLACQEGHAEIVSLLVKDLRVKCDIRDQDGCTPFWIASQNGHIEVLKRLIVSEREVGMDYESNKGDQLWHGVLPLQIARLNNKPEVVSLIERFKKDPVGVKWVLKKELGIFAFCIAQVFALMVLLTDDYLRFKPNPPTHISKFFSIAAQLPQELQMLLANRVFGFDKSFVHVDDLDRALKEIFRA